MNKAARQGIHYSLGFFLLTLLTFAEELIRRHLVGSNAILAVLIIIGVVLVVCISLLLNINNRIEDITEPMRITLLDAKEAYERATLATQNAKREILVVQNSLEENYQPVKDAATNRSSYFTSVLGTALNRGLKYHRILQSPDKPIRMNEALLKHVLACAEQTESSRYKIKVSVCKPRYLVNFLLVDGVKVFIQIDNLDEKTKRRQFCKCIVIEDSKGEIGSVFKAMFDELESYSSMMKVSDLAKLLRTDAAGAN